jgi:hypothetical protein
MRMRPPAAIVPDFATVLDDRSVSRLSSNCHLDVTPASAAVLQNASIPTTKENRMTKLTRTLALSIATCAVLAAGMASAMPRPSNPMDFGRVVMSDTADRDVAVDASTRWVNVTNGQTVRFTVGGRTFTFAFDAWPSADSVPLSAIAPKGVTVPDVRVYIAANPLYQD